MQRESLWEQYLLQEEKKIKQLEGDIHTDILIIGAGIVGILCALKLKEAGISCVVVEKEAIENETKIFSSDIDRDYGFITIRRMFK